MGNMLLYRYHVPSSHVEDFLDDQGALNRVVFERFVRGLGGLDLRLMDPWVWANTETYTSIAMGQAPPSFEAGPVLVHVWGYGYVHKKLEVYRDLSIPHASRASGGEGEGGKVPPG
jgi:hypothetical protein